MRDEWADDPLISELRALRETSWRNPTTPPASDALPEVGLTVADIDEAAARLKRFAPYLAEVFPETRRSAGILESPLVAIPDARAALARRYGRELPGQLWAKLDNQLPIAGSVKARGGIYEVLQHAEAIALEAGLLRVGDDYRRLDSPEARELFGRHRVAVGSTGNLALSIGIMSARLGFRATVHMSSDAREWKKAKLREHGVEVVEYDSDFSTAVAEGRERTESEPNAYFVDDESSRHLFLGYAVAARRLAGQFQNLDITVDADHPLYVYLPCGVGGGPGGVTFGLKTIFGDDVHAVFAEPTHAPSMLLGVYTGRHERVSVQDFGIDNVTAADGLAVGRPSGFVGKAMQHLIDGFITVADEELYRLVATMHDAEGLPLEPAAVAGLPGPWRPIADEQLAPGATHLVWLTGGSMVPADDVAEYVEKGRALL